MEFKKKMFKIKNYNIFCYINKKEQIALTKNKEIGFLKILICQKLKRLIALSKTKIDILKDTKLISNLKLNINLYYKFSNKIPHLYDWYSLKDNKEFIPSFTKKILRQVSTLFQ